MIKLNRSFDTFAHNAGFASFVVLEGILCIRTTRQRGKFFSCDLYAKHYRRAKTKRQS